MTTWWPRTATRSFIQGWSRSSLPAIAVSARHRARAIELKSRTRAWGERGATVPPPSARAASRA
eukprot:7675809-Lingulodinium_polyedra.AAC.1